MDQNERKRIINLRRRIVSKFEREHWSEIGLLTGSEDLIELHPRLIRSLKWGYDDYAGNVLEVLDQIGHRRAEALNDIEGYLDEQFPDDASAGATPSPHDIGQVVPDAFGGSPAGEPDLVAIIMPFDKAFEPVKAALKTACKDAGYRSLRPDDIWEESTIISEIINLLRRAALVIADLTGKNPNVMYETGVSHTLGKLVVPISQSLDDLPFDLAHQRIMDYSPTPTGLFDLQQKLSSKLCQVRSASAAEET